MVPRYLAFFLIAFGLPLSSTSPVLAGSCVDGFANIALHVTAPTTKIPCGVSPVTCGSGINTMGNLDQEYRVYLLFKRPSYGSAEFIEIQIGIDYDAAEGTGVDILGFQACAPTTTPIGNWPEPGSELRMTYSSCQPFMSSDPVILGWFNVIAHTPGTLGLVYPRSGNVQPGTVPRFVTCDLTEKVLDPVNQGIVAFGTGGAFDPCTDHADWFPGPCCLPDNSCQENTTVGCCWAQGGRGLDFTASCAQCVTAILPKTWGRLKSRYN